ncbi:PilW family protein [Pseudomonadota bacterium]
MNMLVASKKNLMPSGFTLIELLVAITISLFVLAGVGVVMVSSRSTYEAQDFNARLQENARFAIQFLSHDLRMAGYWGCASNLSGGDPLAVSANSYTSIKGATVGVGDDLTIEYADPTYSLNVTSALKGSSAIASVEANSGDSSQFEDGDTIVIADCAGAEKVTISADPAVTGSVVNLTVSPALTRNYINNAEVRLFTSRAYSVALNGQNIPTLKLDGADLVQGVELMRFLFGLDSDGDGAPNSYVNRSSSPDLSTAVSVQTGILVRSISNYRNPNSDSNDTREFGTVKGQENDGKYDILDLDVNTVGAAIDDLRVNRHVFTTTLKVRNKAI